MTDVERVYKEIREEQSPYFEDGDIEYYESQFNLPVEDVYNNGASKLLDAIFEYLEE